MKRLGVMTSGGDSPGMNAAIRSIVRTALYNKIEVVGIRNGFSGLLEPNYFKMGHTSVSNIINKGGTILGTSRCPEFKTSQGQKKAVQTIKGLNIEGLIIIGGEGSLRGAACLEKRGACCVAAIPASIDNDVAITDMSIGFDTAVNTALEAIDKIRDTASAHGRLFIVETMGRRCGAIALYAGLAGGAEDILIPEVRTNLDKTCRRIKKGLKRGKSSSIIIIAEGDDSGGAFKIAKMVEKKTGRPVRVTVLGHIQRGGTPTAYDRILASRFGEAAVELLRKGRRGKTLGISNNKIIAVDIASASKKRKGERGLYNLSLKLAI